ncbi:MAG: protein rep [Candidatus Methanospirareceae archaeon]
MSPQNSPSSKIEKGIGIFKVLWLERYRRCGSDFVILECEDCHRRRAVPVRCDIRLCEACAKRRARRIRDRYLPILKGEAQSKAKNERLSLLTVTIRNVWNLEVGFKKLRKAIQRLRRIKYVKERLRAGLYVYEVTVDEYGWYHIHAHFIIVHKWFGSPRRNEIRSIPLPERLKETKGIESKEDLLQRKDKDVGQIVLSAIWEYLTGDPVVDIRVVRSPKEALRYILKYILKVPDFPDERYYAEFLETFEHVPLVVAFGRFRGHPQPVRHLVCECGSILWRFVCICEDWEVEDYVKEGLGDRPPPSSPKLAEYEELPNWHRRVVDWMASDKRFHIFLILTLFCGEDPYELAKDMFGIEVKRE